MIFGKTIVKVLLKALVKVLFFLLIVHPSYAQEKQAQDKQALDKLLAPFASTKHIKITYDEKRFSLFFKQPVIYQGFIEYISPETFIKSIETPEKKKIVIIQDQVTIHSGNLDTPSANKTLSLNNYPQFKQFKALFSGLFKGQASELTKFFHYKITSLGDNKTQLELNSIVNDPFTQERK